MSQKPKGPPVGFPLPLPGTPTLKAELREDRSRAGATGWNKQDRTSQGHVQCFEPEDESRDKTSLRKVHGKREAWTNTYTEDF